MDPILYCILRIIFLWQILPKFHPISTPGELDLIMGYMDLGYLLTVFISIIILSCCQQTRRSKKIKDLHIKSEPLDK